MFFINQTFDRNIHQFDDKQKIIYQTIELPFCRCKNCKAKIRVLPENIEPYARFEITIKATSCSKYFSEIIGLSNTVQSFGNFHPHFSNLHRWLTSFGEYVFEAKQCQSKSAHIAESSKFLNKDIMKFWDNQKILISPFKYHTEKRKELLEGVAKLFKTAEFLYPQEKYPLSEWSKFLIQKFFVSPFCKKPKKTERIRKSTPAKKSNRYQRDKKIIEKGKNNASRSPPDSRIQV